MTIRSYSDLSDSATTFDPEEQFDRDIDERMKGMSKEEAVARAICASTNIAMDGETEVIFDNPDYIIPAHKRTDGKAMARWQLYIPLAHVAIAAADKWDAEQRVRSPADQYRLDQKPMYPDAPNMGVSPGLNSAIQDEFDHPPASIMEEGK
jgi:hypothetical protein